MIVALNGKIVKKADNYIHLDTGAITYQVFISSNSLRDLQINKNSNIQILQIIKEDSQTLYGFCDEVEKIVFEKLLKVNGVGAKSALGICSAFSAKKLIEIIQNSDVDSLKKVSGIGAKSAGKIILELNGFSTDILDIQQNDNPIFSDAFSALKNLGFADKDISEALKLCKANNTQDIIKQALNKLTKNKGR